MRLRVRSTLLTFCLLTTTPVLVPRGAIAAPSDDAKKAREAYNEGQAAFNLGQWEKAIEAWQRGFKIKQDPVFLYNIAQAYRKEGNNEQAVFFYKNYLRQATTAPNRNEVIGWVEQLEREAAEERQRKADAEKQKAEAEQRQRDEAVRQQREQEEARRQAAEAEQRRKQTFNGDIGVSAGVNLWLVGLRDKGVSPSAVAELSGGYTVLRKGRLSLRIGATFAYSYLIDLDDKAVSLFGVMLDPRLRVDVWKNKLFVFVGVGLGAGLIVGMSGTTGSALIDVPGRGARGTFASFEARPEVGLGYQVIPRLSIIVKPGVVVTTPAEDHIRTDVRFQVLAGLQAHL